MRASAGVVSLLLLLFVPIAAWAQPAARPTVRNAAPLARTGFQLSLRLGWMFPAGDATGASGDSLPARFSGQLPLLIGLGAKVTPQLYVGSYLGGSFGSDGTDTRVDRACTDSDDDLRNDIACNSSTLRIGLEAQYHFLPAASVNPWIGYGIGPELATQSITDRVRARDETTTVTGWEFARLTFGVDFRLTRGFGAGPLLEGTFGEFTHSRTAINDRTTHSGSIPNTAVHSWVSLGLRFVLFP
jgi:hypothetical protein